jgi:LysM repeat protein
MGTTIIIALIRDDRVYFGHAGDSRLYLYRNHVLDQMTEDHSIIQQMLKAGLLSLKEAKEHPRRHEITRALGLTLAFEPDISPRAIIPQNDDYLLLCTDGLTNMIESPEISKILDNPFNLNDKAAKLINRANKKGGTDNISVILIRFHNLGDQDDSHDELPQRSIIGLIRNLLRTRRFSFLLVLLFSIGTLFIITKKKEEELNFSKPDFNYFPQKIFEDLIIPYIQKEGESIENVAEKFNTDIETIKRINPNFDGYQLGGHLKIPIKDLYIVKNGDELYLIANHYDIELIDLMKANDLSTLKLKVGMELIIPYKRK